MVNMSLLVYPLAPQGRACSFGFLPSPLPLPVGVTMQSLWQMALAWILLSALTSCVMFQGVLNSYMSPGFAQKVSTCVRALDLVSRRPGAVPLLPASYGSSRLSCMRRPHLMAHSMMGCGCALSLHIQGVSPERSVFTRRCLTLCSILQSRKPAGSIGCGTQSTNKINRLNKFININQ